MTTSPTCPHCKAQVFRKSGGVLKARTSILVLHADSAEINCPNCKGAVSLPIAYRNPSTGESLPPPPPPKRLVLSKKS